MEENYVNTNVVDIPVEGTTEIVPVNNNDGQLEEITPLQMAAGGALFMAVGYGLGKLIEVVTNKWLKPFVIGLGEKWKKDDPLETAPSAENAPDPQKRRRWDNTKSQLALNKKQKHN